jgi:hypothetical protein
MLLQRYSHISIYATAKEYNAKEMSPKSSSRRNREKQAKIEREVVNSLNVVSQEINRKEADKPVYLLRYDD